MRAFVLAAIAAIGVGSVGVMEAPSLRPLLTKERPIVNVPHVLRQENWRGNRGSGSCVYASFISLLRWQGQYVLANTIKQKYGDGQNYDGMVAVLERENIRWSGTVGKGDVAFLEWCHRTRRGAIVTWSPRHVVSLVHFDDKWAGILDNNEVDRIKWIPRNEFVKEWIYRGSWAMTPIYTPPPPLGA
jgi:ABC-type bacteriocin/lantibiotic exporter with double-glycine peptidase domain